MSAAYSDEAIIRDILAGGLARRRASDTFYQAHYGFIIEGKKRYNLPEEDAITAYLEAVTKVIRAIENGRFEGKSKLATFLYRIFFNTCVDISRADPSNRYIHEDLSIAGNLADHAQDQLRDLLGKEVKGLLAQLMNSISQKCRELLMALEIDGFTVEEVGLAFGIKPSSVPQTKYRCLEKLKLAAQSSQLL
ncbi:MAG: sigma-70 family RNA polymerase sigma factor [Bacteroidia bacterium]